MWSSVLGILEMVNICCGMWLCRR